MRSMRKHVAAYAAVKSARDKSPRRIEPADYSDEVSEEQLDAIRKKVAPVHEGEEWTVVDGPAW